MKLSVIIPTLNEEKHLKKTLDYLRKNAFNPPFEITVVDSGSSDKTKNIVKAEMAEFLKFKPKIRGRAQPLNYAADFANGDVLLFLDADTEVPQNYDLHIEKALQNQDTVGGAFEFALEGERIGLRIVELINRIRYRLRKRYYGDQGLFVRKKVFEKVCGFPEIELLESAYLCKSLKEYGNLVLIKRKVITSSRRFRKNGILKPFSFDIKIWFLDLIGSDVEKFSKNYWKI